MKKKTPKLNGFGLGDYGLVFSFFCGRKKCFALFQMKNFGILYGIQI